MNLSELNTRARALADQRRLGRIDPATVRSEVEVLRTDALKLGVGPAFDSEVRRLFADVYDHKPLPPAKLIQAGTAQNLGAGGSVGSKLGFFSLQGAAVLEKSVASRVPQLTSGTALPLPLDTQFPVRTADQKKLALQALERELSGVTVHDPQQKGGRGDLLTKLKNAPGLSPTQRARIMENLAEVRAALDGAGTELQRLLGDKPGGVAYQEVNWKHTRLEVDRVLDVAIAKGLSPKDTETALLASMFSDAVKTPQNFLVHNVHGAQAALHVLARGSPPLAADQLEDIVKATLEHQIGPPGFMANVAMRNALKTAGVDGALVGSICDKIAKPFEAAHLTKDKSEIAFTPAEKEALAKVGVHAWTVPHEGSRHYAASRAVIDGDSLVNYACPDGWAKIAALHGPGQPVFLQEPLFKDALMSEAPQHASALKSFHDARTVISDDSKKLYDQGRLRTNLAIDRVLRELERWVGNQPKNNVPLTKDGKIPYLTGALDYGNGPQVAFAKRLRDEGVRLLRMQEAIG